MEEIITAGAALDPTKNGDWSEDGRPSLKRIRQLAGNTEITQEQLDAALPDLRRPDTADRGPVRKEVKADRLPGRRDPGEPVSDVRMITIEKGFYGGKIREPGESFMYTGIPGAWMRKETAAEAKARKAREAAAADDAGNIPGNWAHEIGAQT